MSAGAIQSLDRKNVTSIEGCPRNRRMLIVVSQFCLVAFTYYCSFLLRLDFSLDMANRRLLLQTLPLVLALKLPLFCLFRSEEHTSELQSHSDLVCRLLL